MPAYEAMLSQQEVDALLAGVTGEAADAPSAAPAAGQTRPYDLGSPERIVRRRMHALEAINDHFARNLRAALLSFMRRSPDISVGTIRIQKYRDFERNMPVPCNLNLVQMKPLRGTALFTFDPNLVFLIIDSLFGGDGRYHTRVEGRDFTVTEQRIIRRVLNLTLDCYGRAWHPVHPIELDYVRAEMHTKFASVTGPNEAVVTTAFRIEFGASGGDLSICLPYSTIEPVRDLLQRPLQQNQLAAVDNRWRQLLTREVRGADVQLSAVFATIDTDVRQLLAMQVGDMLPLDLPDAVTARVDGVPWMPCAYGSHRGRHALRLLEGDPVPSASDPVPHE